RLEIALRRVDPSVALPYWDSTLDERLPNPRDSSLWSDELMGTHGADGAVRTGVFRNWRSIGTVGNLLTDREIANVVATTDYRQVLAFTAPQRGCRYPANWAALEYVHGGDMLVTTSAANDPVFFNHHSLVDLIWEMWRVSRQTRTQRETQYPSDNSLCSSPAHFANTIMAPFSPMTCFNELQCCSIWARSGECERDPSYMNLWCKASCGICTPTTYDLSTG
uniref:ShKT domain-containing protein n=1 Tax=Angiostrongylus cantonensis TaxID=6313 RepID=A0A0K0DJC5_ANGCA